MPDLLEEVRGIADGAGVDFDTMYAYQLVDEIWAMDRDSGPAQMHPIAAGKRNGKARFCRPNPWISPLLSRFSDRPIIRDNG